MTQRTNSTGRILMILAVCATMVFSLGAAGCATSAKSAAAKTAPPGTVPGSAPGFAALANSDSSKYFTDLDSTTASENAYIDYLYEKGFISGYTGKYYPTQTLKRCDLASMLYAKYKYPTEGFSYGDVVGDAYYYQAVMRGKASKVFEDTKYFSPDEAVTREQAAVWIYASELLNGMPSDMTSSDVSALKDASAISDTAKKAVATVVTLGVLSADSSGSFNPKGTFTRSEIAGIVYRLSMLGGGAGSSGGAGAPGGGSQTVDHGSYANKVDSDVSGKAYTSTGNTENAVRVEGSVTVRLSGVTIQKTAGEAGAGDTSNFYGSNAGLLALDGANVTIDKATVNTSAKGANGIFSYGAGTKVTVNGATIRTTKDSSGGVMVTGGGTMYVNDCDIDTKGGSSAALRTDRGGGTLVVTGGKYVANGNGSPAVYCTADIDITGATLEATASEAIVVEGKNSVSLKDCVVSGKMIKDNVENIQNVMIYQSMSGDAATGKSSFTMEGGSLASKVGDMFYVTNTSCEVRLSGVALALSNEYLLKVVGNDARNGWGVVGKNGGQCVFVADTQKLTGKIIVDAISTLALSLSNGTVFTGTINDKNEGGSVTVSLDATSSWSLTGDAYLTKLTGSTGNIQTNGFKVYVGGTAVK